MNLSGVITTFNPPCYGMTGYLSVTIQGGVAPYTLSWENSDDEEVSTGMSARNLAVGAYTLTITDADDTELELEAEITQPDPEEQLSFGMTNCELHNVYIPKASCCIAAKAFTELHSKPSEGIESCKEAETLYAINALDDLKGWNPEGTVLCYRTVSTFHIQYPLMACSGTSTFELDMLLSSSVDGLIYSMIGSHLYTTADDWIGDILLFIEEAIGGLDNYTFYSNWDTTANVTKITVCGEQYIGSEITLTIKVSDLLLCTITDPAWTHITLQSWAMVETSGDPDNVEAEEHCLTEEQVGTIVDTINQIIH